MVKVFRTVRVDEKGPVRLQGHCLMENAGIGPTLELAATRQDLDHPRGIPWPPLRSFSGTQATSTLGESLSSSWLHPSIIPSPSSRTKTSDDQHIALDLSVPRLLFPLLDSELFSLHKVET